MALDPVELATIRAFIIPAKRDRYAALLGNGKRREAFLDGLNHCHDFDSRRATELPSSANVVEILRSHGAANTCHVISDDREIDRREMRIEDAIAKAEASGSGTLLSCIPGQLACYLGESGEQRLLLRRNRQNNKLSE